jgi:hypothetical protein
LFCQFLKSELLGNYVYPQGISDYKGLETLATTARVEQESGDILDRTVHFVTDGSTKHWEYDVEALKVERDWARVDEGEEAFECGAVFQNCY